LRTTIFLSIISAVLLGFALLFVQPHQIQIQVQAQTVKMPDDPNAIIAYAGNPPPPEPVPGQFIVIFDNATTTSTAKMLREANEDQNRFNLDIGNVYTKAIKGYSIDNLVGANASRILFDIKQSDRDVKAIERSFVTQVDTQILPTGINRADAELNTNTAYRIDNKEQKPNIDVAVIDTGVTPHPDLNVFSRVAKVSTEVGVPLKDFQGHGTHVAGTIAARDNLGGVVGMVPGARIWSVQIFGPNGKGSLADMIAGIDYVTANAASIEIANLSGGGWIYPSQNAAMVTAITNLINSGVTFVAAAGNDGSNVEWGRPFNGIFPSQYPCAVTTVICVGAISDYDGICGSKIASSQLPSTVLRQKDADDRDAYYSNWSVNGKVDLYAPGSGILSTTDLQIPKGLLPRDFNINPFQYKYNWGTSMATPHVAGAAAITKLNNPSFTPAQINTDLQAKAYSRNLGSTPCNGLSHGGVIILAWIGLSGVTVPPADCVQNFVPTIALPANWCGAYIDNAKMLDVSAYP
jgi:subtilisin